LLSASCSSASAFLRILKTFDFRGFFTSLAYLNQSLTWVKLLKIFSWLELTQVELDLTWVEINSSQVIFIWLEWRSLKSRFLTWVKMTLEKVKKSKFFPHPDKKSLIIIIFLPTMIVNCHQ
jgi:hypothetical protein